LAHYLDCALGIAKINSWSLLDRYLTAITHLNPHVFTTLPSEIDSLRGFINILAAIKREEKKLEKQLKKVPHQLNGVRSAAKALGSTAVEVKGAGGACCLRREGRRSLWGRRNGGEGKQAKKAIA
jgi:hypothetical protein